MKSSPPRDNLGEGRMDDRTLVQALAGVVVGLVVIVIVLIIVLVVRIKRE